MEKEIKKTHWLESPNKNYLGHQDLINGKDTILTISSAKWEEVKNPITNVLTSKRVIRFKEKDIKPFICNETNAKAILKSTGEKYMEDCLFKKIKLKVSTTRIMGDTVDCIRISPKEQEDEKINFITESQNKELDILLVEAKKDKKEFCESMQISSTNILPSSKFSAVMKRLNEIKNENI